MAEILITISIIGIVSAITIPSIIQKQTEKANITALKKIYSVLSQATLSVVNENGNPQNWDISDENLKSIKQAYIYYKPYLKIIRECENKDGCWAFPTYYLDGTIYKYNNAENDFTYYFTTSDGINVRIDISIAETLNMYYGFNFPEGGQHIWFYVDVNGNKKPNMLGKDIFVFAVTDNGLLLPAGSGNHSEGCIKNNGRDCTAKVLFDEKLP